MYVMTSSLLLKCLIECEEIFRKQPVFASVQAEAIERVTEGFLPTPDKSKRRNDLVLMRQLEACEEILFLRHQYPHASAQRQVINMIVDKMLPPSEPLHHFFTEEFSEK